MTGRRRFRRHEHHHPPLAGQTALAVATPGRLGDGIQTGHCPIHHREIHIHSGFHQLGTDHPNRLTPPEALLDLCNDVRAVLTTHQGREVIGALWHQGMQGAGIAPRVDDSQHRLMMAQLLRKLFPFDRSLKIGGQLHLDPLEFGVELIGIAHDLPHILQPLEPPTEAAAAMQCGLGRRGEDEADTVMAGKQVHAAQNRLQKLGRQQLGFIQHHHTIADVVQLPAAAGFRREQGFEKLYVGGDDDRRIPVLGRQSALCIFLIRIQIAVVLDDSLAENRSKDIGGLLDDAGVRDDVDDPLQAMALCMLQRKRHAGEGLSASGGHGQGKYPRLPLGGFPALVEDLPSQPVDRGIGCSGRQAPHVIVEPLQQLIQSRITTPLRPLSRIHERLGIEAVCVSQAREQHPHPESKPCRAAHRPGLW